MTDPQPIASRIFLLRGGRVLLDTDLARLYGVLPKRLREQVRRNRSRFPPDFGFALTAKELRDLREPASSGIRWAFTQKGAVMLAAVLNSDEAIEAAVEIVRSCVRRSEAMEGPGRSRGVFEAIRGLR